jgi:YbgC/YbaW family acyl-CoA thioester hydrolase
MAYEFKAIRRVEFSDTDTAGIMHYSNFFRFMETAEHGFFRSLGLSIFKDKTHPEIGWPRVHAECDYNAPVTFEDQVEVQLLVSEKKSKALSYIFNFHKITADSPVRVARGALTIVCVTLQNGKMSACNIPAFIADKIEVAPAELLR